MVKDSNDTSHLLDVFTKPFEERRNKKIKKTKQDKSLLPVTQIKDVQAWTKEKFQTEIAKASIGDKTSNIVKELPTKFIESKEVSREQALRWIPKGIAAFKGKPPMYRKSGRENKVFELDPDYFPMIANTVEVNLTTEDEDKIVTARDKTDVAAQIYDNILQYGRRTIDELLDDLGAYQKEMILLITNGLVHDHFLKRVQELEVDSITGEALKDSKGHHIKIETLELVDKDEREKRLQKRRLDNLKKVKRLGKNKEIS